MLFKARIGVLPAHLGDIGSAAANPVGALLAVYVAFKWWERARFFRTLRMARIDVGELYELMQAGASSIVVDVRSATARALEPRWIPRALHVPLDAVAQRIADLPRDRDVILYCACPSEASAARVALDSHESRLQENAPAARGDSKLGWRQAILWSGSLDNRQRKELH